jgi:phenylpyruvate tautomerase PptA (4-oxalocrotonate tautomerase family)
MPQIILHVPNTMEEGQRTALVKAVRETISSVLKLDTIIGQVILYESPVRYRGTHNDRSPNFVFVEVFIYPGRSEAVKKDLLDRILFLVNKHSEVDFENILAVIHEIPKENYYGGMMKQH